MSPTGDDFGHFLRSMAASGLAGKSAIRFAADGALREEPEVAVPDLHACGERSHFVESERTGSLPWPMRTETTRRWIPNSTARLGRHRHAAFWQRPARMANQFVPNKVFHRD